MEAKPLAQIPKLCAKIIFKNHSHGLWQIFSVHLSILNPSRYEEYISTNRENQKSGLWAFLQYGIESYKNV